MNELDKKQIKKMMEGNSTTIRIEESNPLINKQSKSEEANDKEPKQNNGSKDNSEKG